MAERLLGKVALITGAARGQGAVEARLFSEEGASLILTDVLEDDVSVVAKEISSLGGEAVALGHDVSNSADWQRAVEQAERSFGGLDILVNNAGIVAREGVEDTTQEVWDRVVSVNQMGVWLGMKSAIPTLRRRGGGSIVNLSSIYGIVGGGGAAAYQASKGAVRLLSKTAAIEYAQAGIRVNSIHPGLVDTPMQQGLDEQAESALLAKTPMGRKGSAEEIAWGVLFLASDESSYITGSELVIDGGYTAG